MPVDGRLMSAFVKRAEQLKKWQDSETNRTPADVPPHRPSRIKFPDGCVFLSACATGDRDDVRHLLAQGADVNTVNVDGLTALHQACIDGNLDMAELLVEEGADVNRQDNEGWTPLHAAVSCGAKAVAEYLIEKGASLVAINNDGELPVDLAENEEVEDLLQREMDRQDIDRDYVRTMEEKMMLEDARKWWRNKQVEDNVHSRTGATSLHVAAAKGYCEVLGLLMRAGADLNAQDYDGWTPMHAAAHWGQRIACRMLAENLANLTVENYVGQTCFDVADDDMVKLLEELKKRQEAMEKEKPEIKEILERKARCPPARKTSVNRASSAEKITNRTREATTTTADGPPKVRESALRVDRRGPEREVDRQPDRKRPVGPASSPEPEAVPWRRPRIPPGPQVGRAESPPPPRDRKGQREEQEEEEEEEEEKEEEEEVEDMQGDDDQITYKSSVPPVPGERPEMQRKAHAKRARETRRPTQGVTSEELKLAQKLLLQKMALKELEPGSAAPEEGRDDETDEEEDEEEEDERKQASDGVSRLAPSAPALEEGIRSRPGRERPAPDYEKLYREAKEDNERLKERLRKTEEELDKAREQLRQALQNNGKNEADRKERRSLERKISEMEEELQALAKLKNENEKLKAENRALTRTVSKLSKKS